MKGVRFLLRVFLISCFGSSHASQGIKWFDMKPSGGDDARRLVNALTVSIPPI
jgi:hypothetical protein